MKRTDSASYWYTCPPGFQVKENVAFLPHKFIYAVLRTPPSAVLKPIEPNSENSGFVLFHT